MLRLRFYIFIYSLFFPVAISHDCTITLMFLALLSAPLQAADAMVTAGQGSGAILYDFLAETQLITAISFQVLWTIPTESTAIIACTVLRTPGT